MPREKVCMPRRQGDIKIKISWSVVTSTSGQVIAHCNPHCLDACVADRAKLRIVSNLNLDMLISYAELGS